MCNYCRLLSIHYCGWNKENVDRINNYNNSIFYNVMIEKITILRENKQFRSITLKLHSESFYRRNDLGIVYLKFT